MKKALLAALITISSSYSMAGGIPVIDASNLAQALQQVTHMATQITKLQAQLDKAQEHLNAISGARGFGSWSPISYDTSFITDSAGTLETYGITSGESLDLEDGVATFYDGSNIDAAEYLEKMQSSIDQSVARFPTLENMSTAIDSATDQKAIMDLQARISSEQSLLSNERIKLLAVKAQAEAQKEMRKREELQEVLNFSRRIDVSW